MNIIFVWFLISSFINAHIAGQSKIDSKLPYRLSDDQIKPLRQLLNRELQQSLEKHLNEKKAWSRLISQKRMAVGVVDISNPRNVKFARVNGNQMMYAASLPKLAVLLAATQAIEDGILKETEEVKHDMRIMISKSDNSAATRMIDRVGFAKIASVLTDPRYELYDTKFGGGLWVGKKYAKKGERHPDPILGLSHAATVSQVCRFYYLLAFGKLVNFERSSQMLDYLSDPELNHKFVNSLEKEVPDAKLYRKSGTWQNWHSDSVLVWGPKWRRYILTALVEDKDGEKILRELIPVIEDVLKSQKLK